MAISTFKTFLMHKDTSDWEKLIDIIDYPDLGGEKEQIDVTTLTDGFKRSIDGIENQGTLEFSANYELNDYKKLKAMEGKEKEFAIWFGGTEQGDTVVPTGTDGKYKCKGTLSIFVKGGGVNEARGMNLKINLTNSKVIEDI